MSKIFHKPVLVDKVLEFLQVEKGGKYIDATIGGGGHAREILKREGKVLGIDWDQDAIGYLEKKFLKEIEQGQLILDQENFTNIERIAEKHNFENAQGIIFDLGVSRYQLETPQRGFSFTKVGPLDMRMDKNLAVTAKDLLAVLSKKELTRLFAKFSQKGAAKIAVEIVKIGKTSPIETTIQLANLVRRVITRTRIDPATKVFLALRAAVNFELENLQSVLPAAVSVLAKKGRLSVISFHSAEDAIVKNFFRNNPKLAFLTQKPIVPTKKEILENPSARSARLRVAEKIE